MNGDEYTKKRTFDTIDDNYDCDFDWFSERCGKIIH